MYKILVEDKIITHRGEYPTEMVEDLLREHSSLIILSDITKKIHVLNRTKWHNDDYVKYDSVEYDYYLFKALMVGVN